jgi:hypothetical protein
MHPANALSDANYLGIPSPLMSSLIEIYYANVYNASILLHKASFLESLANGISRNHVVLSLCALGAQ